MDWTVTIGFLTVVLALSYVGRRIDELVDDTRAVRRLLEARNR